MCLFRTKRISSNFNEDKSICVECKKNSVNLEYGHNELYYQMRFFKFIFDLEAHKSYFEIDKSKNFLIY